MLHKETKYDMVVSLVAARDCLLKNYPNGALCNIQSVMEILGRDLGVEGEYHFIKIIYYALLYSEDEHKFKMDALDYEGLYKYPSQNDSYQLIDFCTADEYKSFKGLLNDAEIKVEKESLYNIRSYWAMHKFYILTQNLKLIKNDCRQTNW